MYASMHAASQLLPLCLIIFHISEAYETSTNYLTSCAGTSINAEATKCRSGSIIKIQSVTVYASTDSTSMDAGASSCLQIAQCKRTIHKAEDSGLSASYAYLYNWLLSLCEGKNVCDVGTLPEWWALTGETKDSAGPSRVCPQTGIKYFSAVLLHLQCVTAEEVSTAAPPPETSPITRPTTPTSTTPFPVFIPIFLGGMTGFEKVVLAVAIGLAMAIIIVLLLILYCCERYRRSKKLLELLKMLGAPQAQEYLDDDDYSKTETWTDDYINPDALGEYTGVKPDEFMTITRQSMVNTGQIMYDTTLGGTGYGRRNSCSTLSRHSSVDSSYPSVEKGIDGGYVGPMAYDTEENLELERRMAAVLGENDDEIDDSSMDNSTTDTDTSNQNTQSTYT